MKKQLPLNLFLTELLTFDNFYAGPNQAPVVVALKDWVAGTSTESVIYLWGKKSSGATHLSHACCHALSNERISYLPLNTPGLHSDIFIDLEKHIDVALIDHLDHVLGDPLWDEAIFHFYNRLQSAGGRLLLTAKVPPLQLTTSLPDLQSRLSQALIFQLMGLTEKEKIQVLIARAVARGFQMPNTVAQFLLRHCRRDMQYLMKMIDWLDEASLAEQRRLTIPFVKQVLAVKK